MTSSTHADARPWNEIHAERKARMARLTHNWEIHNSWAQRVYKCTNCGVYSSIIKGRVHWSMDEFFKHEEIVDNEIHMPTCKEFEMMDALE